MTAASLPTCYRCGKQPCECPDGITLYCDDARLILPLLKPVDVVLTDPVWPNSHPDLAGAERPFELWSEILAVLPLHHRLLVWLGCQSDPRFLRSVPVDKPFLRQCHLARSVPSYNGRCVITHDVLYAFGDWPPPKAGAITIPGECRATSIPKLRQRHPAHRNLKLAKWVFRWLVADTDTVLDPCVGSGTFLVAAKDRGVKMIGIEIEERYCQIAAARLRQGVLF